MSLVLFQFNRTFFVSGGKKPIVIITEDKNLLNDSRLQHGKLEVFVLKLGDYLRDFWPTLSSGLTLYEGLRATHRELELAKESVGFIAESFSMKKDTGYQDHWKPDAVEAGLKSGKLIQGRLYVDKYHAQKEAFVSRRNTISESAKSSTEDILIAGILDRNRAIHGDIVAIQMLPKHQWKSKINRLSKNQKDDNAAEDEEKEEPMFLQLVK